MEFDLFGLFNSSFALLPIGKEWKAEARANKDETRLAGEV